MNAENTKNRDAGFAISFVLRCATLCSVGLEDHQLDEDGLHDEQECELCIEQHETVRNLCRCGRCCQALIIEVTLRDVEREPKIKECGPLKGFTGEIEGFLLNDKSNDYACRFFDPSTLLCTIYETRPLCCRLFDCNRYEHREPF